MTDDNEFLREPDDFPECLDSDDEDCCSCHFCPSSICLRSPQITEEEQISSISNPDTQNELAIFISSSVANRRYAATAYEIVKEPLALPRIRPLGTKTGLTPIEENNIFFSDLFAFYMGINLAAYFVETLPVKIDKLHFFSGSTIELSWLRANRILPGKARRRVADIQRTLRKLREETYVTLHHINTRQNIADPTIGLIAQEPAEPPSWTGPSWLCEPQMLWPTEEQPPPEVRDFLDDRAGDKTSDSFCASVIQIVEKLCVKAGTPDPSGLPLPENPGLSHNATGANDLYGTNGG